MKQKEGYTVFTGPMKNAPKGQKAVHQAQKQGKQIQTFKKVQHTNKDQLDGKKVAKLLNDDDDIKIPVASHDLRIAISQARNEKKLSQEQLAHLINQQKANISAYESGKSVPTGNTIVKIEKALGCKLPRPPKKKIGQ